MMSIREEEQGQRILVGALLIAGAVALVVWKLSAALGVSMEVGAKIISALVAAALPVGGPGGAIRARQAQAFCLFRMFGRSPSV